MYCDSKVNRDGTITINAQNVTTSQRRSRHVGQPNENGRYESETVETTWTGTLTITIDPKGVVVELTKALSNKSAKAVEIGGAVVARASKVEVASVVIPPRASEAD